jgi:hypothetical protein
MALRAFRQKLFQRTMRMEHRFAVGQNVELTASILREAAAGDYEIRSLMPVSIGNADSPRYRIKSAIETYERVVPESDLTLSTTPPRES